MRVKIIAIFIMGLFYSTAVSAAGQDSFLNWLEDFQKRAADKHISPSILQRLNNEAEFLPNVIALDRKQPEGTLTFNQYYKRVITKHRINQARKLYKKHRPLLQRVAKKFGVQPRFIVALWGIESSFGTRMGRTNVISALATLAYEGRRRQFFERELISALKIIDKHAISFDQMKGSWAGAMGQTQFMPSSYLSYAVDYNADGQRDIWHTQEDVFASMANYLSRHGWDDNYTWGRKVRLPESFDPKLADIKLVKPLTTWHTLGVRRANGSALPDVSLPASLVILDEGKNPQTFLVYRNYKTLLKWNRSLYFATAVGLLSDAIAY